MTAYKLCRSEFFPSNIVPIESLSAPPPKVLVLLTEGSLHYRQNENIIKFIPPPLKVTLL